MLGAVQGLTEFIPISSSGHLVLVPEALGWDKPDLSFDVLLHAASLLALTYYFREDLFQLVRGLIERDAAQTRLLLLVMVATVPAAASGLLLNDFFERTFGDPRGAAVRLIITALILVAGELMFAAPLQRRASLRGISDLTALDAGLVGVAQAFAIFPGLSRSGATIATGFALGLDRASAARFAFLIALPALLGASVLELPEVAVGATAAGFLTCLITSYAAVAGLMRYLRSRTTYPFAIYCVVAGAFFYMVV